MEYFTAYFAMDHTFHFRSIWEDTIVEYLIVVVLSPLPWESLIEATTNLTNMTHASIAFSKKHNVGCQYQIDTELSQTSFNTFKTRKNS